MMNNSTSGSGQETQQALQAHIPPQTSGIQLPGMVSAIEHYRLSQLYQYAMAAERLRCPQGSPSVPTTTGFLAPIPPGFRPELAPFLYSSYCRIDPRLALCRPPDEPKPQHSYIGLIAMAILGHPDKKLVLSDIYQYILDNYPYFRSRGPGWRNSIRHNLSLNDCFVKSGRSANGKGHYWAIHPANVDDFTKGDFRRRKAQRKVRRHMGLAVDDADSPSPPPVSPPPVNWPDHPQHHLIHHHPVHRHLLPHFALNPHALGLTTTNTGPSFEFGSSLASRRGSASAPELLVNSTLTLSMNFNQLHNRKRQFDVASLLAPEHENILTHAPNISPSSTNKSKSIKSEDECETEQCFSRSPSPTSPISKVFKKLSPTNSEDQLSDDEERINVDKFIENGSGKNSSDDEGEGRDEESKLPRGRILETNSRESSPNLSSTRSSSPKLGPYHQHFGSNCLKNRFLRDETVRHDTGNVGRVSSSTTSSILNPLCQHQDPIQHPLGLHPVVSHGFTFNPNHPQNILQHNPSLASLMILSSRYREIASGMSNINNKKSHD